MIKNTILVAALVLTGGVTTAQVGINNQSPKATLDVTAKKVDGSTPEGLIAPRLTGDQIKAADAQYGTAQKGTMVYATAAVTAASTKTAAITAEGYYYFDGSLWQKVANGSTYSGSSSVVINGSAFERAALSGDVTASQNSNATTIAANAVNSAKIEDATVANADLAAGAGGIYKGSGSLSGATTVAQGANSLAFTSTATNGFSVNGNTLSVDGANNRIGIGTAAPTAKLEINNGSTPGAIKIVDGLQATGKVLVSDANGVASWQVNTGNQNSLYMNMTCSTPTDITMNYGVQIALPGIGNYVCQNTGKYELIFHSFFNAGSSSTLVRSFYVETYLNGSLYKTEETYGYTDVGSYINIHYPVIISANAGDVLYIRLRAVIGAPFYIQSGLAHRNNLDIIYLGL